MGLKRRIIALFLIFTILLPIIPLEKVYASYFTDIAGHWAEEYINAIHEEGAVNGYPDGTFRPDGSLTIG